jgi:hypothetical protein
VQRLERNQYGACLEQGCIENCACSCNRDGGGQVTGRSYSWQDSCQETIKGQTDACGGCPSSCDTPTSPQPSANCVWDKKYCTWICSYEECVAIGNYWDAVGGPGYGGQCVDEDACNNHGLFWTFSFQQVQQVCRGLYVTDPDTMCPDPAPVFECGDILPMTNCPYTYWTNNVCFSPVLIDTAGDGLKLSDAAHGVDFDLDGNPDHVKEHLSWPVGADDAWLVLDRPDYDGNGDGVIDSRDGFWRYLRLWIDENRDGVSQAQELHRLEEYDVARLHFDDKASKKMDAYGNEFRYRAKVDDAKGAKVNRWAWDVFLVPGQ